MRKIKLSVITVILWYESTMDIDEDFTVTVFYKSGVMMAFQS